MSHFDELEKMIETEKKNKNKTKYDQHPDCKVEVLYEGEEEKKEAELFEAE